MQPVLLLLHHMSLLLRHSCPTLQFILLRVPGCGNRPWRRRGAGGLLGELGLGAESGTWMGPGWDEGGCAPLVGTGAARTIKAGTHAWADMAIPYWKSPGLGCQTWGRLMVWRPRAGVGQAFALQGRSCVSALLALGSQGQVQLVGVATSPAILKLFFFLVLLMTPCCQTP